MKCERRSNSLSECAGDERFWDAIASRHHTECARSAETVPLPSANLRAVQPMDWWTWAVSRSRGSRSWPLKGDRDPGASRCSGACLQTGSRHCRRAAPALPRRGARRLGGSPTVGATERPRPADRRAHPAADHRARPDGGHPLEHTADGALRGGHTVAGAAGLATGEVLGGVTRRHRATNPSGGPNPHAQSSLLSKGRVRH